MSAEDIRDDLQAWIDGELPAARAREVEAAVRADQGLRARVAELRAVDALLEHAPGARPAPNFAARVAAAARAEPVRRRWWRRRGFGVAAAAGILAVLIAGLGFLIEEGTTGESPDMERAILDALRPAASEPAGQDELIELLETIEDVDDELLPLGGD